MREIAEGTAWIAPWVLIFVLFVASDPDTRARRRRRRTIARKRRALEKAFR